MNVLVYYASSLQEKPVDELGEIFSVVSDIMETAAAITEPLKGRDHVIQGLEGLRERMRIPASNGRKCDGKRMDFRIHPVHRMILIFQFLVNSALIGCYFALFPVPTFQGCCRRYHCPQPSVTCSTGRKTTLVKSSVWGFHFSFQCQEIYDIITIFPIQRIFHLICLLLI